MPLGPILLLTLGALEYDDSDCSHTLRALSGTVEGRLSSQTFLQLNTSERASCFWRLEPEKQIDRIYFTTTSQYFDGDDAIEMFSVIENGTL